MGKPQMTVPPERIPTAKLKGIVNATDEQADLIRRHAFYSKFENCEHRRAGIERELLRLSTARQINTPTHKARWVPASPPQGTQDADEYDSVLAGRYAGVTAERVAIGGSMLGPVKLMVVPR